MVIKQLNQPNSINLLIWDIFNEMKYLNYNIYFFSLSWNKEQVRLYRKSLVDCVKLYETYQKSLVVLSVSRDLQWDVERQTLNIHEIINTGCTVIHFLKLSISKYGNLKVHQEWDFL